MANVDITPTSVKVPQSMAIQANAASSVTSSDTARFPNKRELVIKILNGATTTNVVIKGARGAPDCKPGAMNNGKTGFVRISDSWLYLQSDGMIHMTTDQTITVSAQCR